MLMLAVWWVWVFTSWTTNWLDPDRAPVRIMLFGLMLAGLLLSTSIPRLSTIAAWHSRPPIP
jgi:low temperature requirement protein LtrA